MIRSLLIIVFAIVSINLYSLTSDSLDCKINTNELIQDRLMPDITGITINNDIIDSTFFKGYVTILNFTYLGCPPCMVEMKYLNQLNDFYKDKKFKILSIVAINKQGIISFLDTKDTISVYSVLRRAFKIDSINYSLMPECLGDNQNYSNGIKPQCKDISHRFGLHGYPMTIIIDKGRNVRHVSNGFPMEDSEPYVDEWKVIIDKLLKE